MEKKVKHLPTKLSGYAYFVKSVSQTYKENNKDKPFVFSEFTKMCSQRWKTMSDQEKDYIHKMARESNKKALETSGGATGSSKENPVLSNLEPRYREVFDKMKKKWHHTCLELKTICKDLGVAVNGKKERLALRAAVGELTVAELSILVDDFDLIRQGRMHFTVEQSPKEAIRCIEDHCFLKFHEVGLLRYPQTKKKASASKAKSKKSTDDSDDDDTLWFPLPKMACNYCHTSCPLQDTDEHLAQCWFKEPELTDKQDQKVLYFEARGFENMMRIAVVLPFTSTFEDLDGILRDTWMEPCCGHLGTFHYDPDAEPLAMPALYGSSCVTISSFMDDERCLLKSTKLTVCCKDVNKVFAFEYDSGSTTTVYLRFGGIKTLKRPMKVPAVGRVLMRNEKLKIPCAKCKKLAKYIESGTGLEVAKYYVFCSKQCAGDGCESLSYLWNSPRSGVCGYGVVDDDY